MRTLLQALFLLVLPCLSFSQKIKTDVLGPLNLIRQYVSLNTNELGERNFNALPDSTSFIDYSNAISTSNNYRMFYDEEGKIIKCYQYIEKKDGITEKFELKYLYDDKNELDYILYTDLRNNEFIGKYDFNYSNDTLLSMKADVVKYDYFQGDSVDIIYENGKISSFANYTSYDPEEWKIDMQIDSIFYENGIITGYDKKYYDSMPDTILTTHYRYRKCKFVDDNDDIFFNISGNLKIDTSYLSFGFSPLDAEENILFDFQYEEYKLKSASNSFVLNETKSTIFKNDSAFISWKNLEYDVSNESYNVYNSDGKLIKYYGVSGNMAVQHDYEYGPTGRVSKLTANDFSGFHRIYYYEYDYNSKNYLTCFRELFDDEPDGIINSTRERQFFYFGTLSSSRSEVGRLSIFPNPATSEIHVGSSGRIDGGQIQIFDLAGNLIVTTGTVNGKVNISDLSNGVYIVKLLSEDGVFTNKFIKL